MLREFLYQVSYSGVSWLNVSVKFNEKTSVFHLIKHILKKEGEQVRPIVGSHALPAGDRPNLARSGNRRESGCGDTDCVMLSQSLTCKYLC